jgi:archaellum biogenesis ATPase FlaH
LNNNVPLLDEDAQRLYINSMLSNPELFARVNNLIRPSFFDPHLAKGVKFIQEYFQEYRAVPAESVFKAATKLPTDQVLLPRQDIEFVSEQIAEFCKFQACIEVIRKATGKDGYFETGDLGRMVAEMKAATEIGLMTDLGIDYFDNPLQRLESDETEDPVISTGWKSVDDVIGGGVGRQELVTFLAPSGGGKSVSMLNLGRNLLEQGLNGVYVSLEMRDKKVARRTDQMIARIASGMINMNKAQVAHEIELFGERTGAKFFIKRMREGTTTANDIIAYLRQLESTKAFRPDFIIVDYLDIMAPIQRGAGDNMFTNDKYVSQEVRAIGLDFNCIMISASQLEKGATDKINNGEKMHQGNVQGGSSKTNTSDLMIATVKTDAMHEAGEYRFEFPKARNSDAGTKQVTMAWNKTTLKISDMGTDLQFNKKSSPTIQGVKPGAPKPSLSDLTRKFQVD